MGRIDMRFMRPFAIALVISGLVLATSVTAVSAGPVPVVKHYVDDDAQGTAGSSCDGTDPIDDSIQDAIDAANPNDKVIVCPGSYAELLSISSGKAGLLVRGQKPWMAILRPPAGYSDGAKMIDIAASGVTIKWLRFIAPTAEPCSELNAIISGSNDSDGARIRANRIETEGTA